MNGWGVFGVVVLAIIVLGVLVNARDLARYFKIRSM